MTKLSYLAKQCVVLKIGGATEINFTSIMYEIQSLSNVGALVVLIHGGGEELSSALDQAGLKAEFIDGLRVTDATTLEIAIMVLAGKVNKKMVAQLQAAGIPTVGISGVDGGTVLVAPHPESSDLGYVGTVTDIDLTLITSLLHTGFTPVVAPIATSQNGQMYNINADTMAGEIAAKLNAARLILITNVPGVLDASGNTISLLTPSMATKLSA
ncbi:uncharacterized protein METZ01_LOCUS480973, partial [marine metagenome]